MSQPPPSKRPSPRPCLRRGHARVFAWHRSVCAPSRVARDFFRQTNRTILLRTQNGRRGGGWYYFFRQTNRTILLPRRRGGDPSPPIFANNSVARCVPFARAGRQGGGPLRGEGEGVPPADFRRFEWELWRLRGEGGRDFQKTTVRGFLFAGSGLRHKARAAAGLHEWGRVLRQQFQRSQFCGRCGRCVQMLSRR